MRIRGSQGREGEFVLFFVNQRVGETLMRTFRGFLGFFRVSFIIGVWDGVVNFLGQCVVGDEDIGRQRSFMFYFFYQIEIVQFSLVSNWWSSQVEVSF